MSGGDAAWRLLAAAALASAAAAALALALAPVLRRALAPALRRRLRLPASVQSTCRTVLISNDSALGNEIRRQLEVRGCTVRTVTSDATVVATSGAGEAVDALVMIGAEEEDCGLDGLAKTVSINISHNLKLLETLIPHLRRGGRVVWVNQSTGGAASGAFSDARKALDNVVRAQLALVADTAGCEPVWLGDCGGAERAAGRAAERAAGRAAERAAGVQRSVQRGGNAAANVGSYIGRWLKIIT